MVDKDYIFNIPKVHVQAAEEDIYVNGRDLWNVTVQEIGEFLQVYSKYTMFYGNLIERQKRRDHFVEEMVHILVCFGAIALREGISQKEIDSQIQRKAFEGVKYPFDVRKPAPLDQVLKDLKNCSFERTLGQIDSENSCLNCKTGEFGDVTMTCKPLLEDALYYLQQAYGKAEGPDQK